MPLAASSGGGSNALAVVLVIVGIVLYVLPGLIASKRRVTNTGSVWVVNLFLGWTFVGWIVALAMAVRSSVRPAPEVTTIGLLREKYRRRG